MNFTTIVKGLSYFMKANSSTILSGLATGGVIATGIFAAKGGMKAQEILVEENLTEAPMKEKTVRTWKCYIPAVIMAGGTIASIVGAQSINLKRQAAWAGAYSISKKMLEEYKDKVVETIGEDKEKEVRREMHRDVANKMPVSTNGLPVSGTGSTMCYDVYAGQYFLSDKMYIDKAVNDLNAQLLKHDSVSYNDFRYALGFPPTKTGDELGWSIDKCRLIEVIYDSQLSDNSVPCLTIEFENDPEVEHYINRMSPSEYRRHFKSDKPW